MAQKIQTGHPTQLMVLGPRGGILLAIDPNRIEVDRTRVGVPIVILREDRMFGGRTGRLLLDENARKALILALQSIDEEDAVPADASR